MKTLSQIQNKDIKHTLVCCVLILIGSFSYAQDEQKKSYVTNTFMNTQLVNVQTPEVLSSGGFEFKIQHRFGTIDKDVIYNFFGFDLPANIRFSLSAPITKNFYIGIGRTKFKKVVDVEAKYLLLRQTEKNEMPVSVAVYFNAATSTERFSEVPDNAFFSDSITPFENKFAHRISYNTQVIIARKFTDKLSLQVAPVFVYQNLVDDGRENITFALPVSGRFKYSRNSAIIIEYTPILNNRTDNMQNPASLGIEFGTAGHVFQLFISSENNILENAMYTNEGIDYTKGNFVLGFNIKRIFWKRIFY